MIEGLHPVLQALLGTLFTWGLTALGSAMVFVLDVKDQKRNRQILDGMLGFAAGVMLAASYWSLLAPALEIAEASTLYGENGEYSWLPVAIGFLVGGLGMHLADAALPIMGLVSESVETQSDAHSGRRDSIEPPVAPLARAAQNAGSSKAEDDRPEGGALHPPASVGELEGKGMGQLRQRKGAKGNSSNEAPGGVVKVAPTIEKNEREIKGWRRTLLLIIAITLHNFPEGMAVGVGFGSVKAAGEEGAAGVGTSFQNARSLAIGIGLQNFPEGLAVSMPLRRSGLSLFWSFWMGQLSGMVEPIGGILGAMAVSLVEPLLPYALAFAAGAMIFVVVDDLVPEAAESGNTKLFSAGTMIGFVVMMTMDVALG